jgi:hypothetical protein
MSRKASRNIRHHSMCEGRCWRAPLQGRTTCPRRDIWVIRKFRGSVTFWHNRSNGVLQLILSAATLVAAALELYLRSCISGAVFQELYFRQFAIRFWISPVDKLAKDTLKNIGHYACTDSARIPHSTKERTTTNMMKPDLPQ